MFHILQMVKGTRARIFCTLYGTVHRSRIGYSISREKSFSRTRISRITDGISLCCGAMTWSWFGNEPCIPYVLTMGPALSSCQTNWHFSLVVLRMKSNITRPIKSSEFFQGVDIALVNACK